MSGFEAIKTFSGKEEFNCYVATPDGPATAAVIVIQEVFGVNEGIRQKCDKLAAAGYLAVAPDLFWRLEPGVDLDPDVQEEFQKAIALMQKFDVNQGVRDIEAAVHYAREATGGGKVGCVGYCLGGRMAYLCAARTDMDASVGYYGVFIDQMLGEKNAIANPLMLHIPEEDGFVDKEAQARIHEGLDDHPKVTIHDYPGMDHGFATEIGQRRDEENANLADQRTADFFAANLA